MKAGLKKYIFLPIVAIIIISIFVFYDKKSVIPTPTPYPIKNIQDVKPGISTLEDLTNIMGDPKNKNGEELFYNSKSPTRDNIVRLSGQTVGLIKEAIAYTENRNINEIKSKYGDADNVLYGEESVNGNYLFVYLGKGIAYIGNPNTESLTEIWRFSPITDIDTFIKTWAKNYSKEIPTGNF